jgi:hypothetical protein
VARAAERTVTLWYGCDTGRPAPISAVLSRSEAKQTSAAAIETAQVPAIFGELEREEHNDPTGAQTMSGSLGFVTPLISSGDSLMIISVVPLVVRRCILPRHVTGIEITKTAIAGNHIRRALCGCLVFAVPLHVATADIDYCTPRCVTGKRLAGRHCQN